MNNWKRIIAALVILGLLYSAFIFVQKSKTRDAGEEISYRNLRITFLVKEVENNVSDYIIADAIVVDHESGLEFGKIKDYLLTSHMETEIINEEQAIISYPAKSDLYLTVEASATELNDSYVVAAKKPAIGKKIALYSKEYACYGTIIKIEEIDND
ncbi:MAG: DUF4330 family protein [Peptostreptococcaceae bacterium]|nr:DUF4330 family protein [Peptostreptococcaceae bacterium]